MRLLPFVLLLLSATAQAYDVTSKEARAQNLLEYIAGRTDLSRDDKTIWERALRLTFGGQVMKDGDDEGITTAKSVIAFGIFHQMDPKKVAQAAYEAKADVYAYVPPPVAIHYQTMKLEGHQPPVPVRLLANEFPKYFDDELAPDIVKWWEDNLKAGKINPYNVDTVKRQLKETRALMRP